MKTLTWFCTVTTAFLFLCTASRASAADWPQWLGPDRSGASKETGLLQSWPEGGPKQVWMSREGGIGYSSFAVVGDRVYTMGAGDSGSFVIALNAKTGKRVWRAKVGRTLENGWGDGPRGTPTVDGNLVFAMGGRGDLVCLRARDGREVWRTSMSKLGGGVPGWGYTESVLVDGNAVLCTPGGRKGAVAALNKKTGKVLWQSKEFTDGAHYSSIVPAKIHGVSQFVQRTEKSVVGVDRRGKLLWKTSFPGSVAVIPTPIVRDSHVYVTAGYGAGCKMVSIDKNQNATQVYANKTMKNHHGGVIPVGEHLYGYSDGPGWVCQDFESGEMVWNERRKLGKGAVTYADGRLYCVSESGGHVALVEASPDGYKEHGRFQISPQTKLRKPSGRIWAHPVVANGKLYLRDQELLFCYDISAK